MYVIDTKLKEREAADEPIQCGILGAGEMTLGLVNQIERHVPGMRVAAIYNRTILKAERCYRTAGHETIVQVENAEQADSAIVERKPCIVTSADCLWKAKKIDVIVEMTGTTHKAFEWILEAMKFGKKVVSFNAELDATMGPYLQKMARQHNTRYTLGDGDQPGVTMNLWRQVKMMGFTPLVCGNVKGFLNNHRTPDDQRVFAEQYGLSLNMVTSFTDGTKVALEQASIANATGMQVSKRGMITIRHDGHIDELTGSYDIEELKARGGIVEMVVGAKPGPGVFVFASSDDPVSQRFLEYGKLGSGPLYSFYVPYHLLFFELPFSIARLVDYDDGTLDSLDEFMVEVIAMAKRDLKAGETLDGLGGYMHYGLCENTPTVRDERLLPAGLTEGKILLRDVPKDSPITWNDVKADTRPVDAAYHSLYFPKSTNN
jgi:predicted homoserine dehydrogenase-like protein